MTKLAHDSYLQGALDFLKTASIDSDIGQTALEVLIKESSKRRFIPSAAEARASNLTPTQMQELATTRSEAPMLREQMKALKAEQAAAREALISEINLMRSGAADQLRARQGLESELERARRIGENYRGRFRDTSRDLSKEMMKVERAVEAEQAAKRQMRSYRTQSEVLTRDIQALREAQQAEQAAAREALAAEQKALAEAKGALTAEQRIGSGLSKQLKNVKMQRAGLGGLAALGLGYIGYDQLSDSGVPSAFAETPPSQPLGPPLAV